MEDFEGLAQIGEGTYGRVYRARWRKTGARVALKRISVHAEKEGFPLTAMREIKILRGVAPHENIVGLLAIVPDAPAAVYMALEYMDFDLVGLQAFLGALGGSAAPGGGSESQAASPAYERPAVKTPLARNAAAVKCVLRQLLVALDHLHRVHGVAHRDLKGSNVLLRRDGIVKLADFGLAKCVSDPDAPWDAIGPRGLDSPSISGDGADAWTREGHVRHPGRLMTNRVITLWFRPPEILLGATAYGTEVDVWGVGCVLGEMLCGGPLFCAPEEVSQLEAICRRLGPLPQSLMGLPWYDEVVGLCPPCASGSPDARSWALDVCGSDALLADLLLRLLSLSPSERPSAAQALNHPYFSADPAALDPKDLLPALCADAGADVSVLCEGDDWHEYACRSSRLRQ